MPGSEKFPRLAALAVVPHQGQLLLVRRAKEPDAGKWGYPGGHVEWGETVFQAAARELREETGIVARPERSLLNLDIVTRDATGVVEYHFLLVAVLCQFQSGAPLASDDALAAEWVPFEHVQQRTIPLSENVDTVLDAALQYLPKA